MDAGDNQGCSAADQRGFPRPMGPACDIGAYEAGSCLDFQLLTPFPQAFPGPDFLIGGLRFVNPRDPAGNLLPLVVEDRTEDEDGRPELMVGYSSSVGNARPFTVELTPASFPAGVTDALIDFRLFTPQIAVQALDDADAMVDSESSSTNDVRVRMNLSGPGIRTLRFDPATETLLYRICWK